MPRPSAQPLLDLDTLIERPFITIDGEKFDVFNPDELSVVQNLRFVRWGERIRELQQAEGEQAEAELDELVDRAARAVLVEVDDATFAKLSGRQRMAIVEVFSALLLRYAAQAAGAMHRVAGTTPEFPLPIKAMDPPTNRTGAGSSRGWCGSITSALASCWRSFLRPWS